MKRIFSILLLFLFFTAMVIPVSAQSSATVGSSATVSADGSCRVSLTATISMTEGARELFFPIPAGATDVTLNGGAVSGRTQGQALLIPLNAITGGNAGQFSISINYTLPGIVATAEDEDGNEGLVLTLPILCGFSYPVETLEFSVTLPGNVSADPVFTSAYHQENIGSALTVTTAGNTISGSTNDLKDHETLTMALPVDETMFPETAATARVLGVMDLVILIAAGLSIAYYLLTMRPKLPKRFLRSTAPDGITAGDTALWFTGSGLDLSLLVVTWAQLGYLRIQVDDSGRVLLHKRMDMGNERSVFENRCYKNLFGRSLTVDGTGYRYAELCRSVSKKAPQIKSVYRSTSGNPKIFLALCAITGLLSGITLAAGFAPHSTFLRIFLALLTAGMSLALQSGGRHLLLREKLPVWIAAGCTGLWLLLGILSGEWLTTGLMVAFQWFAGLSAAFGGKRTELGQHALAQLMGLRRFMGSVSKKELLRLLRTNPGYFHELAPYALALGMDRTFARRFGRLRLPECTYLVGRPGQMTAAEWAAFLRTAVHTLDAKAKRLPLERLMGR